ncbi:MAG: thiamine-phosphate kinase [Pseudomonadota bacterium]
MPDEFALIKKYFAPLSHKIGDDCAVLDVEEGQQLVTSTDTLVEGRHFPADAPPDQIAYRAVATATSDLAAMGADAKALTLALTLPTADDTFLQQFSRGITQATEAFGLELVGGDTTAGPLAITCTVMGTVPRGAALLRAGAKPGDRVFVSGTLGDAAAALSVMNGEWPGPSRQREYLLTRFYRPTPRLALGQALRGIATSAIDVSDGLLADAGHVAEQSGVGIRIEAGNVPINTVLTEHPDPQQAIQWALAGGDDYELLFTVAAHKAETVPEGCTCIGEVVAGEGVHCDVAVASTGYRHFDGRNKRDNEGAPYEEKAPQPTGDLAAEPATQVPTPAPFTHWAHFLAFGFGSGLSPKAPGTAGTLVAIPLYLLMTQTGLTGYTLLLLASIALGVYLCEKASRDYGVHDHPGIVWDEFAGFWVTMWAVPPSWQAVLAGFLLFRLLDIAKPWPIRALDKNVKGGFGIMVDDLVAGVFACALMHLGFWGLDGMSLL